MTKTVNVKGVSLVEIIVVTGLISFVLSIGYLLIDYTGRSFETVASETFLQQNARNVDSVIRTELRNVTNISLDETPETNMFFLVNEGKLISNGNPVSINIIQDILFSVKKENESFFLQYKIILNHQGREEVWKNKLGLNNYIEDEFEDVSIKNRKIYYKDVEF